MELLMLEIRVEEGAKGLVEAHSGLGGGGGGVRYTCGAFSPAFLRWMGVQYIEVWGVG